MGHSVLVFLKEQETSGLLEVMLREFICQGEQKRQLGMWERRAEHKCVRDCGTERDNVCASAGRSLSG